MIGQPPLRQGGLLDTFSRVMNPPSPLSVPAHAPDSARAPTRSVVLLVEDDDTLRSLTRMMLEDGGFDVIDCATARYALQVLTDHPTGVNLLLTDVNLPGMSGPDLVHAARGIQPDLPTVYVTGWDRMRLHAWGVPPHALILVKPFLQGDLVAVAQRALWTEPAL